MKFEISRSGLSELKNEVLEITRGLSDFAAQLSTPSTTGGPDRRLQGELALEGLIQANQQMARVLSLVVGGLRDPTTTDQPVSVTNQDGTSSETGLAKGRSPSGSLTPKPIGYSEPEQRLYELCLEVLPYTGREAMDRLQSIIRDAQSNLPRDKKAFRDRVNQMLDAINADIVLDDGTRVRLASNSSSIYFGLPSGGAIGGFSKSNIYDSGRKRVGRPVKMTREITVEPKLSAV